MTKRSTLPFVSTADQDLEKNKADILQLANHHDLGRVSFVEEKISGKVSWRNRKLSTASLACPHSEGMHIRCASPKYSVL